MLNNSSISDNNIDDQVKDLKEKWNEALKQYYIEDFIISLNSFEINQKNRLKYYAKANFI